MMKAIGNTNINDITAGFSNRFLQVIVMTRKMMFPGELRSTFWASRKDGYDFGIGNKTMI